MWGYQRLIDGLGPSSLQPTHSLFVEIKRPIQRMGRFKMGFLKSISRDDALWFLWDVFFGIPIESPLVFCAAKVIILAFIFCFGRRRSDSHFYTTYGVLLVGFSHNLFSFNSKNDFFAPTTMQAGILYPVQKY